MVPRRNKLPGKCLSFCQVDFGLGINGESSPVEEVTECSLCSMCPCERRLTASDVISLMGLAKLGLSLGGCKGCGWIPTWAGSQPRNARFPLLLCKGMVTRSISQCKAGLEFALLAYEECKRSTYCSYVKCTFGFQNSPALVGLSDVNEIHPQ